MVFLRSIEIERATKSRDHNRDPKECLFYRVFASPRFYTAKTHKRHAANGYSITSSARNRVEGGMARPSVLAVLRLMTSPHRESL